MIMRGRRRRDRAPAKEPKGSTSGSAISQPTPPADGSTADADADLRGRSPASPAASAARRHPANIVPLQALLSDVATAHAELDDVLPPPTPTVDEPHMTPVLRRRSRIRTEEPPAPNGSVEAPPAPPGPAVGSVEAPPSSPPPAVETLGPPTSPEPTVPAAEQPAPRPTTSSVEESADPSRRQAQAGSLNPLPRVMAVANQKGGVGKTTTSVNLGAAIAELGFRVLVIDLDPQGNATTGLGVEARSFELSMYDVLMREASMEDCVEPTSIKNLFVAPATIDLAGAEIELVPAFSRELKLKKALESVIDDFDYVLIDCPPSLGLLTVNALAAAHEVLVPIQCEYYALEGLSQLMRNVHLVSSSLNPDLDVSTIVLTMYDARTKLADEVAGEVRQHFGSKVCRIVIPRTVRLSEAPSFGQPITVFDPTSRGAVAYRELAKEVSGGSP